MTPAKLTASQCNSADMMTTVLIIEMMTRMRVISNAVSFNLFTRTPAKTAPLNPPTITVRPGETHMDNCQCWASVRWDGITAPLHPPTITVRPGETHVDNCQCWASVMCDGITVGQFYHNTNNNFYLNFNIQRVQLTINTYMQI